jgi:HSP20 family protein
MTDKTLDIQKEEVTTPEGTERTRECRCFAPRADIYELENQLVIVADVPGANETSIDITLEKNVLTINALVEPVEMEGHSLLFAEYEAGDYQRSFKLSDEIDQDNIQAEIKEGVLHIYLPKAQAKQRKVSIKTV